jgi:N-acetylglucosamine malate deacetylase 1
MAELSRREALCRTMVLGLPLLAAGSTHNEAPAEKPHKLKVLVTGGHPGDPEYGCGGTIARYSDLGHEVVLLYLNRGEGGIANKTGAESAAIRSAEAEKACALLKARPLFASQIDGQSEVNSSRCKDYLKIIQQEQPDIVFTHWPIDNHPDHRANFLLVYDAWLQMGKRFSFYYYEVSTGEDTLHFSPTHYVDIGQQEPRKRAACFAHASESPEQFYALQEQVSRFRGIERGWKHAEAFIRHLQSPDFPLPHN